MKKTVVFALAAALISTAPLAAFAQQTPNPDVVRFVCRDAGLGKHSNVAKRLKNSIKAAAAMIYNRSKNDLALCILVFDGVITSTNAPWWLELAPPGDTATIRWA